ncbi:MAG: hypothetical protein WCO56_15375 [Verrucomicrobiota bacterium]
MTLKTAAEPDHGCSGKDPSPIPLKLLSVIIPARDEEGCIASTVGHLHLELTLNQVPH